MTTQRNLDRLIRTYLEEDQALGQPEVPDHVYGAIRDGIEQTRQRAVIGSMGVPDMNKFLAIGLGSAAVVVALLIGSNLIGSSSPPPGGAPSASAEPSEGAPSSPADGILPEGPFVLTNPGQIGPPITVTIPAPGWHGAPGDGTLVRHNAGEPPNGAALIGPFLGDLYVYGDPCNWSTTTPDTPATTVDEAVAALAAQASRDASAPVDITVDGYPGKSITLHVPDDAVFGDCDEDTFASWAGGGDDPSAGPSRYHQGPGQIDELWIMDVDGELIVVDGMYGAETSAQHLDELHAILESMTFE